MWILGVKHKRKLLICLTRGETTGNIKGSTQIRVSMYKNRRCMGLAYVLRVTEVSNAGSHPWGWWSLQLSMQSAARSLLSS